MTKLLPDFSSETRIEFFFASPQPITPHLCADLVAECGGTIIRDQNTEYGYHAIVSLSSCLLTESSLLLISCVPISNLDVNRWTKKLAAATTSITHRSLASTAHSTDTYSWRPISPQESERISRIFFDQASQVIFHQFPGQGFSLSRLSSDHGYLVIHSSPEGLSSLEWRGEEASKEVAAWETTELLNRNIKL